MFLRAIMYYGITRRDRLIIQGCSTKLEKYWVLAKTIEQSFQKCYFSLNSFIHRHYPFYTSNKDLGHFPYQSAHVTGIS